MNVLRVYVSSGCAICERARRLIAEIRAMRPEYAIEVIECAAPDVSRPAYVFGTPTYVLRNRIISLGNPARHVLLDILDAAYGRMDVKQPSEMVIND